MSKRIAPEHSSTRALTVFQPMPDTLYSLDATAHLAGITRRSLLMYCRAGLVRPTLLPPYGILAFTDETICTVRRIEHMREEQGLDLAWMKTLFDLLDEVDRLRAEVRFLRGA